MALAIEALRTGKDPARSQRMHEVWDRPGMRDKITSGMSKRAEAVWKRPGYRAKRTSQLPLLWQDPDFREKVNQARSAKEYRDRMSEAKGGIRTKLIPFVLRGGLTGEISGITGVERPKVSQFWYVLKRTKQLSESAIEAHEAQEKAARYARRELTEDQKKGQKKGIEFAKKLVEAGFITDDVTAYERLKTLYRENRREMPSSLADRIRLEVFYDARDRANNGDSALIKQLMEMGKSIDKQWIGEEEQFIERALGLEPKALLDHILGNYHQMLYKTARDWTNSKEDADDVIQTLILRWLEKGDYHFPYQAKLQDQSRYLTTVIKRAAIDMWKRSGKDRVIYLDPGLIRGTSPSAEQEAMRNIFYEDILRDPQGIIILLNNAGFPLSKIAIFTGIPIGTVKTRIRRAKARLANQYR